MERKTIAQIVTVMVVLFGIQLFIQINMIRRSISDRIMDFKSKVNVAVNNAMINLDKSGIADYYEKEGNDKFVNDAGMSNLVQSVMEGKHPSLPEYRDYFDSILNEVPKENYDYHLYDSVIASSLSSFGIDHKYVLAFYDETARKFIYVSSDDYDGRTILAEGVSNTYLVVNSNDMVGMLRLILYFPDLNKHYYMMTSSTWVNILLVVLMMVLSILVVVLILRHEKENSDMKVAFLNNMTHELKTPISTIKLVCEAMSDDNFVMDKEASGAMVKMINDENERMLSLVDEMLKSVRISRGYAAQNIELIDVHESINSALNSLSVLIDNRKAVVTKDFAATNVGVMAHKNNMIGAFSNIIENALKYSEGTPEITIKTYDAGKNVRIDISDKGIGISKSDQKKIFDEFFRANTGDRHDIKGYGIGLSYVKSVVTHCKGKITVSSKVGEGTTFTIELPLAAIKKE